MKFWRISIAIILAIQNYNSEMPEIESEVENE